MPAYIYTKTGVEVYMNQIIELRLIAWEKERKKKKKSWKSWSPFIDLGFGLGWFNSKAGQPIRKQKENKKKEFEERYILRKKLIIIRPRYVGAY